MIEQNKSVKKNISVRQYVTVFCTLRYSTVLLEFCKNSQFINLNKSKQLNYSILSEEELRMSKSNDAK